VVQQSESKLFGKIPPVYDHAVVKGPDAIASGGLKKIRDNGVNHAAKTGVEHAKRERHGVAEMLKPGFPDIFEVRLGPRLADRFCSC